MVLENLRNGSAYKKFEQLVQAQGGDLLNIKVADTVVSVKSKETGFISHIETDALCEIVRKLGGGRYEKD